MWHSLHMGHNQGKYGRNRAVMIGTLLGEQTPFSTVTRLRFVHLETEAFIIKGVNFVVIGK
jgi:hypothetical protein